MNDINLENLNVLLAEAKDTGIFWIKVFGDFLPFIQVFSILVSLFFLGMIVFMMVKLNVIGEKVTEIVNLVSVSTIDRKRVLKAWKQILNKIATQNKSDIKIALIEADKIMDEILKVSGFRGDSMAERLEQITPAQLSNIERIWRAHKLRNRLVHETDYEMTESEARIAIDAYHKAFQEFGLLNE
ncbi:MAG: hypothetical protein A2430_00240 [Candidatus Liptonbacteria bacterium RIFOXYC1_FULL_36_8]|uniref:DUF4145 domain-containing protein n=3 Tax=Candidatus Liptoniibacteriota TaxID=1817909 RepID=A0A1G2CQ90_9BACT|nr:MAG: hypothetical protein A2390_02175 [Candidatus Liptonbacteria bacterium RIFOXYB1_FULL_36_10]OGZ03038.1 MAG: hypothetical protein A2604_01010 [Candidatus Liptonbacteria bacterium RIFOXYD1_FULL_36_11]OGZ03063.1 MAG: hypothetical protein A2430_00240 [Candidatus Liptonbacteria bacterium RIFOXYC1_FULL_36_8]